MGHTSRISEYEQRGTDGVQGAQQWASEMVEAQPLAVLCGVFAAGFVVGVGAVTALAASATRPQPQLNHLENLSERIADAVSKALPRQLSDLWHR